MVQRGLPNRLPFGQLHLDERTTGAEGNGTSAGLLAAGTVISLSLPADSGVVFSEPPTAQVTWTKAAAIGDIDARDTQFGCAGGYIPAGTLFIPICRDVFRTYVAHQLRAWDYMTASFGPTGSAPRQPVHQHRRPVDLREPQGRRPHGQHRGHRLPVHVA